MTKRKRHAPTVEDVLERPWCYYCERDFDDLKILISHQKAKHYKCSMCNRRLNTAGGLSVHMAQVHKETLSAIENALPNRRDVNIEIFGMEGVPEDVVHSHRQRITTEYFKRVAEHRQETGNPPSGSNQSAAQKRAKIETPEEIKQRLAEHKARREAERLGKTVGADRGSTTPLSANGSFATPGGPDGQSQNSPMQVDSHQAQASMLPVPTPFVPPGMMQGPPPMMSPGNGYYGPPMPLPMGPGAPFGMPPHMAHPMPPHMPPHLPMPPHMPPHGMPMYGGPQPPPFSPPPGGMPMLPTMPSFPPMQQQPRPGGPPFTNGPQHSPPNHNAAKAPAELNKQQSPLDLGAPGLPARPSTNVPNLTREDMARLHAGAPARQASGSHTGPPAANGVDDQPTQPAAENTVDGGNSSVRESEADTLVPAVVHDAHNKVTTSTRGEAAADEQHSITPTETAETKPAKALSSKKAGRKSKSADKETRLVYSDDNVSPEEKRAGLARYAFVRDESTDYVMGDAGPAVTGPVRGPDDVMDAQAAH